MGNNLKIRGCEEPVDPQKLERVMKCLSSIARSIAKDEEIDSASPQSGILKQLLWHARKPTLPLEADLVQSIASIKVHPDHQRYLSGPEICSTLFGDTWRTKLQSPNGDKDKFSIVDNQIRAIIRAAKPRISITFDRPLDITDPRTFSYEQSIQKKCRNREYDRMVSFANDPDLHVNSTDYALAQTKKELGWREFCRDDNESSIHIG